MISHLKLRLLASALTMAAVLHPAAGHCRTTLGAPSGINALAAALQIFADGR